MSNIYITEPNTEGKVLLHTSFGDLDVELWPQQAPKACRNFVQLCLEGYYDHTIFHRIIAGFMVQGGDPTGTGNGGESIYGAPFIDEFHSRLKFNHRGLLAMANANKPDTNHSQFFFTLDACEFLERKHTIFGKITGNTIFNLLSVGDLETDAQDRPTNPPKLLSTEVLWNPFDDIVPREIKRKEPLDEATAQKRKKKERKATKDLKLLSFGEEEEEFNQALASHAKKKAKKMMSSHDLLDDRKLKADVDQELAQKIAEHSSSSLGKSNVAGLQDLATKKENARLSLKASVATALKKSASTEPTAESTGAGVTEQTTTESADKAEEMPNEAESKRDKKRKQTEAVDEYTQLREELRRGRKAAPVLLGSKAKDQEDAKAQDDMLTPLQQQRQKYLARKKALNRSGRQQETLLKLQKFQATLADANKHKPSNESEDKKGGEAYHGQVLQSDASDSDREDAGDSNSQPDLSWMASKLKFKKHIDDQFRAGYSASTDDYTTIDTRNEKASASLAAPMSKRDRSRDRSHPRRRDSDRSRYERRDRRY